MTVKDRVGRTRYLAFRLHGGPLPRATLASALPPTAKLTRYDGTYGILRTTHRDREAVQAFLDALAQAGGRQVRVETLTTSGTIRKAAEKVPEESGVARRSARRT